MRKVTTAMKNNYQHYLALLLMALLVLPMMQCKDDDAQEPIERPPRTYGPISVKVVNYDGSPAPEVTVQIITERGQEYPVNRPLTPPGDLDQFIYATKTADSTGTVVFDSVFAETPYYVRAFQKGIGFGDSSNIQLRDSIFLIPPDSVNPDTPFQAQVDSLKQVPIRLDNQRGVRVGFIRPDSLTQQVNEVELKVYYNQNDFTRDENAFFTQQVNIDEQVEIFPLPALGTIASGSFYFFRATAVGDGLERFGGVADLSTNEFQVLANLTEQNRLEPIQPPIKLQYSGSVAFEAVLALEDGSTAPAYDTRVNLFRGSSNVSIGFDQEQAFYSILTSSREATQGDVSVGRAPFVAPERYYIQAIASDAGGIRYSTNPENPPSILVQGGIDQTETLVLRRTWDD